MAGFKSPPRPRVAEGALKVSQNAEPLTQPAETVPGGVVPLVLLAEQLSFVPPPEPAQDQLHGPLPDTDEAEPTEQRLVVGADATVVPLAVPHEPLTTVVVDLLAEQLAVVPPFEPAHVHDHGPVPLTDEAEPTEQRLVVGAVETVLLLELPQEPFTGVGVPVTPGYVFTEPGRTGTPPGTSTSTMLTLDVI